LSNDALMLDRLHARVFHGLQGLARRRGWDLHSYRIPSHRFFQLPVLQEVDLVLDVGAAIGMYGQGIRATGYTGRISSFEPMSAPYRLLEDRASADPTWSCYRLALGAEPGTAEINVAANSDSSSLLPMEERHERGDPNSVYVGKETIEVSTVDTVWDEVVGDARKPFLKLDIQGFELHALRGAERSLPRLHGVQTELSLVPLYEGGAVWTDVITHLQERGFHVAQLAPAFSDSRTGEVLQLDGIFTRHGA
jgi:FkbM family methyltransferase